MHLTEQKFAIGSATKLDILSAKSNLETDKAMLPKLLQRRNIAKHGLAILVGKAPADWQAPDFNLNDFTLPKELPVSLPSQLVQQRPDILAAEANLRGAAAAVGVATANLYPNIVITANTLQQALTPGAIFNAVSNTWAYAANITAPLFTGGTLNAEKRKALLAYDGALSQYQQTILNAFNQVADALTALAHDANSVAIAEDKVNIARSTLDLSYQSYKIGSSSLLEILTNQKNLSSAEIDLIEAKNQRYIDTARLFVVLGGSPIK